MNSKRQWSLLTALGCVAVLVAGFLLLVQPQNAKANSLGTQTQGAEAQTQQLRVQLATLQEESRNLASEQVKLDRVVQQLPPGPQLSELTRQLDKAARDSHVDLVTVAPGPPAPFVATATAAPAKAGTAAKPAATSATTTPAVTTGIAAATAATAGSGLLTIPVALTASGDYFNVERFLDTLEGLQRSMLVDGFTVTYQPPKTGAPSATPQIGSGELTVSIQTRVFLTAAPLGQLATPAVRASTAAANGGLVTAK